jgi:hypothetical protein
MTQGMLWPYINKTAEDPVVAGMRAVAGREKDGKPQFSFLYRDNEGKVQDLPKAYAPGHELLSMESGPYTVSGYSKSTNRLKTPAIILQVETANRDVPVDMIPKAFLAANTMHSQEKGYLPNLSAVIPEKVSDGHYQVEIFGEQNIIGFWYRSYHVKVRFKHGPFFA